MMMNECYNDNDDNDDEDDSDDSDVVDDDDYDNDYDDYVVSDDNCIYCIVWYIDLTFSLISIISNLQ